MLLDHNTNRQTLTVFRLIKVFTVLILMIIARQAFADDCASQQAAGWQIGYFCGSLFDNGEYVGSFCQPNEYDDPSANMRLDCLQSYDQGWGVCEGADCSNSGGGGGDPGCTYYGYCQWDWDCCGMNSCDWETNRCREPEW
jgi:hypothetical protein